MIAELRLIRVGVILFVAALSGCATVGSGDFACPGRPEGVRCASATEVYAMTEGSDVVDATADKALGDDPERAAPARRRQASRVVDANSSETDTPQDTQVPPPTPRTGTGQIDDDWLQASTGTAPVLPLVHKPIPVRTPAQVMRVWIAPWEDKSGVLHIGGYHFVEIHARRWTFGEQSELEPVRLFSIQEGFSESTSTGGNTQQAQPVAAKVKGAEQPTSQ